MIKAVSGMYGRAIIAAIGTTQRALERAATTVMTEAIARRGTSGSTCIAKLGSALPELLLKTLIQSNHRFDENVNETRTMAPVAASATKRLRHSRRARNHSRPIPGVTFVSSRNEYVHGHRNPATTASVMGRKMLPLER